MADLAIIVEIDNYDCRTTTDLIINALKARHDVKDVRFIKLWEPGLVVEETSTSELPLRWEISTA